MATTGGGGECNEIWVLTQWTGAAISTWIHEPAKSKPKLAAINNPAHDDCALLRFCRFQREQRRKKTINRRIIYQVISKFVEFNKGKNVQIHWEKEIAATVDGMIDERRSSGIQNIFCGCDIAHSIFQSIHDDNTYGHWILHVCHWWCKFRKM